MMHVQLEIVKIIRDSWIGSWKLENEKQSS